MDSPGGPSNSNPLFVLPHDRPSSSIRRMVQPAPLSVPLSLLTDHPSAPATLLVGTTSEPDNPSTRHDCSVPSDVLNLPKDIKVDSVCPNLLPSLHLLPVGLLAMTGPL